jgi:hypothetical protein
VRRTSTTAAVSLAVFEGKNGLYDPATDKEFPARAPPEGDPAVASYWTSRVENPPPSRP